MGTTSLTSAPLAVWRGLCWEEPWITTMVSLGVYLFTISQVHPVPLYSDATSHVLQVRRASRETLRTRQARQDNFRQRGFLGRGHHLPSFYPF